MANHPTRNELSGFVLGMLPPESTDEVAEHLEQCPPCQETVCELDAHIDTLLTGLRQPVPPVDDACRTFVEKAKGIPTENPTELSRTTGDATIPVASLAGPAVFANPVPSRDRFLSVLLSARLIDEAEWSRLQHIPAVAEADDGATLASALVEQGVLTKFQATAVYHGNVDRLLFGEYIVLDEIGAGGMGQVFKARHRRMDRIVALKVLAQAAMRSPDAVKRFQQEVKAAAKLIHPNIVIAHDAGDQDGTHFLVMEFVPGSDLAAIVKRDGPLAVDQAVSYILQAARGLAFAHAEGVVHRDVKPGNLLVDHKGIVRILDMGLARLDGDLASKSAGEGLTQTGAVMGTVDYMAPEQAYDTSTADAKADVYGLGCTLFRVLTGQNIYSGETLVQKVLAHREQPIPSLATICPQVSPQLDAIYQRMVAKRPAERPTMNELVGELEALTAHEPTASVAMSPDVQPLAVPATGVTILGGRKPPPSRMRVATAAAGFFCLALFGIWFIIRDKDGNEVARIKAPDGSTVTSQSDSVSSFDGPGEFTDDLPPWNLAKGAPQPALAPFAPAQAKELQAAWAKHLGRPAVQENSLGMSLSLIPPGEFDTVYTQPNDPVIKPELTRRRLRISQAFDLGTTEVTVAQFRQFVDATGYATDAEKNGQGGFHPDNEERKPEWTWKNPGNYKQSDNMPVVQISWNDAVAFCDWLSKKEGARYRLPTEAEWEFACRAGSVSYHAVCDKLHDLTQHAWVRENGSLGGAFVRPVGNWKANAFGLFDVLGNAWEWCADGGDRGSAEWTHPVDPWGYFFYPNVRGCGFDTAAKDAHPAFRRERRYELQRSSIGFRVLRQVAPDAPPGPLDRPLLVNRNSQLFRQALVARPAPIPGLRSWSVELAGNGHYKLDTRAAAWSPQGDRIATTDYTDPLVRLWDSNGKLASVLPRHTDGALKLSFSPDGKWLATAQGSVGRYCIWNVATGACHAVISDAHPVRPAYSPDGTAVVCQVSRNSKRMFLTFDLNTGRIVGSAVDAGFGAENVAWSPDRKTIATITRVADRDSISFHTAPGLQQTERLAVAKNLQMLVWSPDGKWLAVAESNEPRNVSIYDAETHALKATLDRKKVGGGLSSLSWSQDSRRLLEGGDAQRFFIIWDALTGDELLRSTGGGGPAAWSPDEQEIVVGGAPVRIFNAQTGLLKRSGVDVGRSVVGTNGHKAVFTDGERLFVREGSSPNTIMILNVQTGALLDRWEKLPSGGLSLSPTRDQIAIFGKDKEKNLFVIDAATGKQLGELKPHPDEIRTVAWSPDGQQLASGGKDKVLRIWNIADAKLLHALPGHASEIFALAWSPDGKQVASADIGAVSLWDPAQGSLVATHQAPGKLRAAAAALAWTPDSQALWLALESNPVAAIEFTVASATWSKTMPGVSVGGFFPSPDSRHWLLSVFNHHFTYRRGENAKSGSFLKTAFRGGQWHPDSRRFVSDIDGTGWIRGYDVEADQPLGVVMPAIIGNNWLVVGPEGHYNGSKGIEDHLVYVAQTDTGEHVTLSPADFAQRYGWKNDPAQARLLGPARAGLPVPSSVGAPKAVSTQAAGGSLDLLKLVDLSRDVHAGTFKADGGAVVSAATENSLFEVPTSVPREYQLTLTVRRAAGSVANKGLLIGLPVAGQRVDAGIDIDGGKRAGLADVEGVAITSPENPTRVNAPRPLIDGPNLRTIVCTVRPPQIQVSVDGKTIIDFAEPALLNSNRMTRLFDSVYLETETAMRIERLEIKPLQTVDSWQPRINRERQFPSKGLAAEPAKLSGIGRWQVDTVGTRSNLTCVAISPDGKQVACGNHHGQIRIYDPETWRLIRCWSAHPVRNFPLAVNSLAWSPDGTQIASAGSDGLCLWQPDGTLQAIRSLGLKADIRDPHVCWSPDGSRLAVSTPNSTIRLFSRDGTVGPSFKTNTGCIDFCFSPDGKQLVIAAGIQKAKLINLDGSSGPELVGQEGSVEGVSWSKLGQIATVSTDKTLRFWGSDGKPGPVVRDLAQGNGTLRFVRWSPDGTRLVVSGNSSPMLLISPEGELLAKESHGGRDLGGVAWSADGQRVAYVANHSRSYHPGIWDLKGKPWNMPEYQGSPETLAWSPDGRRLAMSTDGGSKAKARIIDANGTVAFPPFPVGNGVGDPTWSPDGKRLALALEKTIRLFDVSESSIVASPTVLKEGADRVRWSPDGRYLASRGGDKTIRLWNLDGTSGPVLQAEIGRGALAWLNPETLIAGDVDGNKKPVLQQWKVDGTKGPAWPVSVSPDHVAVSPDGRILLVNGGNSGRTRLDLISKESSRIGEVGGNGSWSKDGMQWLTSSQSNHGSAVRLMDTATNKPVHVLPLFAPRTVELSSTGVIAACSNDYTVRAWESATGRPLWTTICLNDDQSITLAADGRVLQHRDVKLDDVLFYWVEREDGQVETLTHSEFVQRAPDYLKAP